MKLNVIVFNILMVVFLSSCVLGDNKTVDSDNGPVKIIFETDMGNDVDDAMALDMLYKYIDMDKIDLLGIMLNKNGEPSAQFVDIMNNWYGYPDIPVGVVRNGADSEHDAVNYAKCVVDMKDENGESVFEHSGKDYSKLPEAHKLYREILSNQPDSSVVVVSVGFSTNLARLLDSPGDEFSPLSGKELVAKKVKYLSNMAACFNNPDLHEYNVAKDIAAAKKVFEEWPTTIITSPFEVGIQINYPATSIENDFSWAPMHPMVEAYKCYLEMPYDRPTWDLTSVLYAAEGSSFFDVSPTGNIKISENASSSFETDSNGKHQYLSVDSIQAENIKQHFIELISSKPKKLK
jgi:inosine-uridine nucleoside N-ribohydrolase